MSALTELQLKIGVTPDGVFGPTTLKAVQKYYKLSKAQTAHFMGQCAHESGNFARFEENLNYSADGLMKTFKKYFPTKALADQYARKPEAIANRVYANRMGNGDEASGDGWKFRGRGALQVTGKSNYVAQGHGDNPDEVATKYAFDTAIEFFTKNSLWTLCNSVDDASITNVTKRVNGGVNGLDDRKVLTKKFYSWL